VSKDTVISWNQGTFVGRVREIAELCAGVDDANQGRGRFFLITGEPGIGKTRLADEVSTHAVSRGMAVLRAGCWEGAGAPAYWPFIQILRTALRRPEQITLEKLIDGASSPHLAYDLAQLVPELQPQNAPPDSSTQPAHDSDQTRFRLYDSVATAVKRLGAVRPLMLVLEDLHDADQPSLLMLRFVVRDLKNTQVMVIATYRDVEVQRSPALSRLIGDLIREGAQIPLFALSLEDTAHIVEQRAGVPLVPRLISDIHQATAGNPLFIDGLVRVLAAEGTLSNSSQFNLASFRVSDGVREAIRRWLALLSDRSTLIIAATMGQAFDLRSLQLVAEVPNYQIQDALREAAEVGIVIPVARGSYSFTHALIRNALSDELNAAERAGLQSKIAQALEAIYQPDIEAHLTELAFRFREGGDINKAIDYSIRAGEAARAVFAYEEAIAHWKAALELMSERPDDRDRRANLLERTAELLGLSASDDDEHLKLWREALKLYKALGRPQAAARVESRIAGFVLLRGSARGLRHLERNQDVDGLTGQDREARTSLVWRLIAAAIAAGESGHVAESRTESLRALEISEQLGDAVVWGRAAMVHAVSLFQNGDLAQSLALTRRVSDEADRVNDAINGVGIVSVCTHVLTWLCDPGEAIYQLERELDKPRMAEAPVLRSVLHDWLRIAMVFDGRLREIEEVARHAQGDPSLEGLIAYYRGEWEQADLILSQTADREREGERYIRACSSAHWLARSHRALGRQLLVEAILKDNLAFCISGPVVPFELHTRAELASVYAEEGRPEQAHPHLERCREVIAAGEDWRGLAGHVARAGAAVAAAEGQFESANEQFGTAVDIYRRYQVPFEQAEALHLWGRALLTAGEHGAALEKLDAAAELYSRHGAGERWLEKIEADRLRAGSVHADPEPAARAALAADMTIGLIRGDNGKLGDEPELQGTFRKQGEYWTVSWAGHESRLKHRKGMLYLVHLLRHPGHEFAATDLIVAVEPGSSRSAIAAGNLTLEHQANAAIVRNLGDAGTVLDAYAKAQYRRRLEELRDELELAEQANDLGRADKAHAEIDFIEREIAAAVGLGGRDRKSASHAERARLAVTKAIKAALNHIRAADPELARHLSLSIQTGYFCAYNPREPVAWQL
jgi:tetratricopeptide (TPR) repeat protein